MTPWENVTAVLPPQPAATAAIARAARPAATTRISDVYAAGAGVCHLLWEFPELPAETQAVKDVHVLLACVRHPAGRDAVVPPRERELGELRDRDRDARLARAEPRGDVLLRPEE